MMQEGEVQSYRDNRDMMYQDVSRYRYIYTDDVAV